MVTKDIRYIGVNDRDIDLFEGQYPVPNGIAYNSYVILDEKVAVMDTVDHRKQGEFLANLEAALDGRKPDYLVVHHVEPDHASSVQAVLDKYPDITVVAGAAALKMLPLYNTDPQHTLAVKEGDVLTLGRHELQFIAAPMVHWPEVMITYEESEKVLFSADAFGTFGAPGGTVFNDEIDFDRDWLEDARRYYSNIVGKYGPQVQAVLKKAAGLDIQTICPLHGPVLKEDLGHYIGKYDVWSSYTVESEGIVIAYTSVYGNTKKAVEMLAELLRAKGCPKVIVHDLARCDMSQAVADAFRYGKLVLATTTYNAEIFPFMKQFIDHLTERNYQKRTIGLIENGSWAPLAAKIMKGMFEKSKDITWLNTTVKIKSAVSAENKDQLQAMADELCQEYIAQSPEAANKNDLTALFRIGYGLYVVTSNDGKKDNGLIVNTVTQLTDTPNRVAVNINKANYSHHIIKQTGILNVNCLSVDAPFSIFERFGFQSGRTVDKFEGITPVRSDNGLIILPKYINAAISLKVEQYVDLDTHGMFICSVTEARVMNDKETMTYTYYQNNVKPKPDTEGKKGFVCKICGYIYEGDVLPDDFICPLCKHGVADFEPIQ